MASANGEGDSDRAPLHVAKAPIMTRERLPARRRNVTHTIQWGDLHVHIAAGFDNGGRLLEAFVRAGRVGSERDHQIDDIAVLISRLLQHGDRIADVAAGVGRLPSGEPASVVGAVLNRLMEAAGP
jgi:hypothetical protein